MPLRIRIDRPLRCEICGGELLEHEWQYAHEDACGVLVASHSECKAKKLADDALFTALKEPRRGLTCY